jgi:hypothetical protein
MKHAAIALTALMTAAGCGGESTHVIDETRSLDRPRPEQIVDATSTQRFGAATSTSPHGGMGAPTEAPAAELAFDLPAGWKELPPTQFRNPNFAVTAREAIECYATVLAGGGGGLAANLNRWRGQMGLAPLSEADVAALPRVNLLGADATYVEMDGTFGGRAGWTLAGVALERAGAAVFVKMTGPSADVRAETDRFKALVASLRESAPAPAPVAAAHASAAVADPTDIRWTAPEGWTQGPAKQMRVVTLSPKDQPGVECYVSVLSGAAGGLEANVNRWRQQLSLAPLPADKIAALPEVPVLGRSARMIEIDGGKVGMLGLVCELEGRTVFVKMTGPMDVLRAERERFVAFCRSLS